jgi:hypothetical protein
MFLQLVWIEVGRMTRAVLDAVCKVSSITVLGIEVGRVSSFHSLLIEESFAGATDCPGLNLVNYVWVVQTPQSEQNDREIGPNYF